MREIKFRGQSTMSGKWFYGSLIKDKDHTWISVQEEHWNLGVFDNFDVVPKTVGQYTGLKDKNGKEIYEGDILNCRTQIIKTMKWSELQEVIEGIIQVYYFINYDELEVIGNIYENPELLGGVGE